METCCKTSCEDHSLKSLEISEVPLFSNYLEVKDGYSLLDSQVACPAELQVRLPAAGRPRRISLAKPACRRQVLGTSYLLLAT